MAATLIFSVFLVVLSAMMLRWHTQAWSAEQSRVLDGRELSFYQRQYRRRCRTSGLIGLVGVALALHPFLTDPTSGFFWLYWIALLLGVLLLGAMATIDMLSTQLFARELCEEIHRDAGLLEQEFRSRASGNQEAR